MSMSHPTGNLNFEAEVLPHLDAAYNLARWLTRNPQDAEDMVQEALLRAFRFFRAFRGGNARAWLLRIVRNTCYTFQQRSWPRQSTIELDETLFSSNSADANPEETLLRNDTSKKIPFALEALSPVLREVLILRELEGMSYQEISEVADIPPGTVMSRLSRARGELRHSLASLADEDYLPVPSGPHAQLHTYREQAAL